MKTQFFFSEIIKTNEAATCQMPLSSNWGSSFFHLFLIIMATLVVIPVYGQENGDPDNAPMTEDELAALPPSLLYEFAMEGDGQPKNYIFGTFSPMSKNEILFPEALAMKIDQTFKIVLPIHPNEIDSAAFAQLNLKDTTLTELLSETDYQLLDTFAKQHLNTGIDTFNNLQPFAIMDILKTSLLDSEVKSYDNILLDYADRSGKEVLALETFYEYAEAVNEIPLDEQVKILMDFVKNHKKQKDQYRQILETYLAQNPEVIFERMLEYQPYLDEYRDGFIDQKNFRWLERILELAQEPAFIAVGVEHLSGEMGLLQQLRQNGYIVKPVSLDDL